MNSTGTVLSQEEPSWETNIRNFYENSSDQIKLQFKEGVQAYFDWHEITGDEFNICSHWKNVIQLEHGVFCDATNWALIWTEIALYDECDIAQECCGDETDAEKILAHKIQDVHQLLKEAGLL